MSSFRHLTPTSRILRNENKLPFSNEICNPMAISDRQLRASAVINTYWQTIPPSKQKVLLSFSLTLSLSTFISNYDPLAQVLTHVRLDQGQALVTNFRIP